MANILTNEQVIYRNLHYGQVVWLEISYYDHHNYIAFMQDFKDDEPVLVNAYKYFCNDGTDSIEQYIKELSECCIIPEKMRYRWWDNYPTEEECKSENGWTIV